MDYWQEVMNLKDNGKSEAKGVANILTKDDLETILATADFFQATESDMRQIYFDLYIAKYRLFDWLAMALGGRIEKKEVVKVFVYSFVKSKGIPSKFIEDLRITDYDIDRKWENLNI